jgi:hypothetical protein
VPLGSGHFIADPTPNSNFFCNAPLLRLDDQLRFLLSAVTPFAPASVEGEWTLSLAELCRYTFVCSRERNGEPHQVAQEPTPTPKISNESKTAAIYMKMKESRTAISAELLRKQDKLDCERQLKELG